MKFKWFKIYIKTSEYGIQNCISHSKIIWLKSNYIQTEAWLQNRVSEFGYHLLFQSNRDIALGDTLMQLNLKCNNTYKCYTILKQGYPLLFFIFFKTKKNMFAATSRYVYLLSNDIWYDYIGTCFIYENSDWMEVPCLSWQHP
jgi:hypothetical protein